MMGQRTTTGQGVHRLLLVTAAVLAVSTSTLVAAEPPPGLGDLPAVRSAATDIDGLAVHRPGIPLAELPSAGPTSGATASSALPTGHLHDGHLHVLVFSRTAGFRHDSIPAGIAAIQQLGAERGWQVDATEDPTAFTDELLAQYDVVVFLSTTGDVLDDDQQAAFERYIQAGGGYAGIHAASDTEYSWPWYGDLVGAYFAGHPAGTPSATITVADPVHPSTAGLPRSWERTDEWYNFQSNPRGDVHVLASLEEHTIAGGGGTMGADHPIAWCHDYDGGRSWYTGGGHTSASYSEAHFLEHLRGGIESAGGAAPADCGGTVWGSYEKVALDTNTLNPMKLDVADDGRVFFTERVSGELRMWDPATAATTTVLDLDVYSGQEDGLLAVELAPDFIDTGWLYLYYAALGDVPCPPTDSGAAVCGDVRLSRFTLDAGSVDPASEVVLLSVTSQRDQCCHAAGDLAFDADGNLYVSTGDDTNPFESSGYTPTDERAGRSSWDAQRSSANTNDLRGKVLRIRPEPDGTYSVPEGNLFPAGTAQTRPEIYAMGFRNPFTITVDPQTGWVGVGEFGPDAGSSNSQRGPDGRVEWNLLTGPGNHGWPYCVSDNTPYRDYDFATTLSGPAYDCANPTNDSPNNTGLTELPPAQPATAWMGKSTTGEPTVGFGGAPMTGPVVRHDATLGAETQLPAYFDGTAIFMEWNQSKLYELKLDEAGRLVDVNPFLADMGFLRPHHMERGPDGSLYLIEWGSGFGGSNGDSGVYRIDYTTGTRTPVAVATATPDSGPVPLEVQFSAAESRDPDPGDVLTYAWDFTSDGTIDSTEVSPTFTYTDPGDHIARLEVTDSTGKAAVANVPITAGNTRPDVALRFPPDGGVFSFGDQIAFDVAVTDAEDGSTADGSISCEDVTVSWLLGHDAHGHPLSQTTGCSGVIDTVADDGHAASEHLFGVIEVTYTDRGGDGASPLTGRALHLVQPRHQQAEHFTAASGITVIDPSAGAEGGRRVGFITDGDWIAFEPIDLTQIDTVGYRIAAGGPGGRIEVRADAPDGPLVAVAEVPSTGSWDTYATVDPVPVTDPGGTHRLYLVFRGDGDGLFDVDAITWGGKGVSLNAAPVAAASASPTSGAPPLEVTFTGSATDHEGQDLSFTWDFGDGATGEGPEVVHVYEEVGTYTATLTVTDTGGATGRDRVQVAVEAPPAEPIVCLGERSDRFDEAELDRDRWSRIVREQPGDIRVVDGSLLLPTGAGDIYGPSTTAGNLVLQPAPLGRWEATTRLTLSPTANYQQAGLILYGDDDDYVKLDLLHAGGRKVEFIAETAGTPRNDAADGIMLPGDFPTTIYLRLSSDGAQVSAAYSADGHTFTPVGRSTLRPLALASPTAVLTPGLGVFALGGDVGPPVVDAAFDWFHLIPDDTATDPGVDDEFDGDRLDGCRWDRVVRPDPTAFSMHQGTLRVETRPGDIFGTGNSAPPNLFLQTMPSGDWAIETAFTEDLVGGYQQAGLMAYADDDTYVKLDVIADGAGGVDRIELRSEVTGTVQSPQPNLAPPANDGMWWLRLRKTGTAYTGEVSTDGHVWVEVGEAVPNSGLAAGGAFGVFTLGVNQAEPATVAFDHFLQTG